MTLKNLFPLLFLSLLFLQSCGGNEPAPKVAEGEVNYELTYPHADLGFMGSFLPDEMKIVFKESKMLTTVQQGKFFKMDIISDETAQSVEMYLDFDTMQYKCVLTKEEVEQLKQSQPEYTYVKTVEEDSLAGMLGRKYEMNSKDSLQPSAAWFTEDLSLQDACWLSSYHGIPGFPIIYDIERYGIMTHAAATNLNKREVKASEFELGTDFKTVDFETFESGVQDLFDLIVG